MFDGQRSRPSTFVLMSYFGLYQPFCGIVCRIFKVTLTTCRNRMLRRSLTVRGWYIITVAALLLFLLEMTILPGRQSVSVHRQGTCTVLDVSSICDRTWYISSAKRIYTLHNPSLGHDAKIPWLFLRNFFFLITSSSPSVAKIRKKQNIDNRTIPSSRPDQKNIHGRRQMMMIAKKRPEPKTFISFGKISRTPLHFD